MRIAIDLQGEQACSRSRGIGRYSASLARVIARNSAGHEIHLLLNADFPESAVEIRREFEGLIPRQRIHTFRTPLLGGEKEAGYGQVNQAAEMIRERALALIEPDFVLVTSLFEGYYDTAVTSIGSLAPGLKTAVVLYDLIPMGNPDLYLADMAYRDHYQRKVEFLRRADLLLAISEHSRQEARDKLGIEQEKIRTISAAADSIFKPLDPDAREAEELLERYGIRRDPVLFAAGGFDRRKNLETLIEAYSKLPEELRERHQLVVSGLLPDEIGKHFRQLGASRGLDEKSLLFTGCIPEREMPLLFNLAFLAICPSLAEGFGLPVMESMSCGTPVIASDIPPISELLDLPSARFDPRSPASLAACLEQSLRDEDKRESLRQYGLERSRYFSWDRVAAEALTSLEDAHALTPGEPPPAPGEHQLLERIAGLRGLPEDNGTLKEIARAVAASSPRRKRTRQLFCDISTIFRVDIKTGIQRVVRAELSELIKNPPSGFSVKPIYLERHGHNWLYRCGLSYLGENLGLGRINLPRDPVEFRPGDILFMPDYAPYHVSMAGLDGLFTKIKAEGVFISTMIYDLLPLFLPDYFNDDTVVHHNRWMREVARFADQFICISDAVAEELREWLMKERTDAPGSRSIVSLHLGADIESSVPTFGDAGGIQIEGFLNDSSPTFLMVGTIEPRKGHLQALAAFDLLWDEGTEANLLIVGREGWQSVPQEERKAIPGIVKALRGHPQRGKRLIWLDDADDDLLISSYDFSTCLLAASEAEGFGLPLIEASRHGTPILARDIPVFREVAGDCAAYFSGMRPEDLAAAIRNWLGQYRMNEHPTSTEITHMTWAEHAEKLKELLMEEK